MSEGPGCDKKRHLAQSGFSPARLAQSVEGKALNLEVVGSSPTVGWEWTDCTKLVELRPPANVE